MKLIFLEIKNNSNGKISHELICFLITYGIAYSINLVILLFCIDLLQIHDAVSQVIAGMFLHHLYFAERMLIKNKLNNNEEPL